MQPPDVLKLFSDLISIESVSADPHRRDAVEAASNLLSQTLTSLGFEVKRYTVDGCPPLVIAVRSISPTAQTMGIYGHYDVQPEEPAELWTSPPFTLTERDGHYFGRGVADDKGHIVQNIAALAHLIHTGKLNKNAVFVLEGEEEVSSEHLEELLTHNAHAALAKVDAWLVTDMGAHSLKKPQIFNGLRGIVGGELTIRTATKDGHSGVFGNRIYNPAQILCDIVAKARDSRTGLVHISGFYDHIVPVPNDEYRSLVESQDSLESIISRSGALTLPTSWGPFPNLPPDMPLVLTSKLAPSFDVNSIVSGYTGSGAKTIIPSHATLKFSCRIVPGQKARDTIALVSDFFIRNIPEGVEHSLSFSKGADPFYTTVTDPWMRKVADALSTFAGVPVVYNRSGGSIPAAEILQRLYRKPVILTGFTLPGDNIHAPDENFNTEMFWWGIEALKRIYGGQ